MTITKHGGLTFFKLGRFGGSVYLARSGRDTGHVVPVILATVMMLGLVAGEVIGFAQEVMFTSCMERILTETARDGLTRECRMGG